MLISVIIPVYNVEKYLQKCIDSILLQTVQDFELLLIDDGSTDKSGAICDLFAAKDKRIYTFHQKNAGVSAARNKGLREALGDYIVFVDSDDWVDADYLEVLLKNMQPGGLSACRLVTNEQPEIPAYRHVKREILTPAQAQISIFSYDGMQGFPVAKIFDRKILATEGIFFDEEIAICEDVLFAVQYCGAMSKNAVFADKAPYHYRKMNVGSTNKRYKKGTALDAKQLTEYVAIKRCEKYLYNIKSVQNAWKQRLAKGAVTDLRAISASGERHDEAYKERLSYLRHNIFVYLTGETGAASAKISALLCAVTPKLEYAIWRKANKM